MNSANSGERFPHPATLPPRPQATTTIKERTVVSQRNLIAAENHPPPFFSTIQFTVFFSAPWGMQPAVWGMHLLQHVAPSPGCQPGHWAGVEGAEETKGGI